jgi:hypothetical protein
MTNLTDDQRSQKIEEIFELMNPLKTKKISLDKNYNSLKENYFKKFDKTTKDKIITLERELNIINQQLTSLTAQLRQLQFHYLIIYEAEYMDSNDFKYWQMHSENFFFQTNYNIDTIANGGDQLDISNPNAKKLLIEIHKSLYGRFSNFKVNHIKRV